MINIEHSTKIPNVLPQTLIVLIGLPGCGKSTFATNCLLDHPDWKHISSDNIRFNENITDNTEVFDLMFKRTKETLNNKGIVIYDATNLSSKRRRILLSNLGKSVKHKICYAFIEPYEECLKRNKQRTGAAVVPNDSMLKMISNFQVPMEHEGFDEIHFIKTTNGAPVESLLESTKNFNQETHWHKLSLYDHMIKTKNSLCNTTTNESLLSVAALYHDIGKPITKTFKDRHGNTTKDAHYYGHENAGAYLFLSNETNLSFDEQLKVAKYINWHMRPFQWETDTIIQNDINLLGEEFVNDIKLLHEADTLSEA